MEALKALHKELKLLYLQNEISRKTQYDLDEEHKEYFLKQQIRKFRKELGDGEGRPERKEMIEKAKGKGTRPLRDRFKKELPSLTPSIRKAPTTLFRSTILQTW